MLAIRLPQDIEVRLEALARATGRTKSYYTRQAILEHLDDLEALYLAERRALEFRASRAKAIPQEVVIKMHGVED
jgi:RHH-type rel operon transcriptional repressor/antitoxin RelB